MPSSDLYSPYVSANIYADLHVSQTKMAEVIISPPDSPAERVRDITQYLYPDLLLLAFITIGATHSVYTAMRKEDVVIPTVKGPGGKPLPVTKRRVSTPSITFLTSSKFLLILFSSVWM